MSEGKKPGLLHFLQRLFGLGGDKLKPARPAPPAKKNRASHAPKRKLPGKGSAHKKPSSDKEPVLRPISPQRRSPPSPKSGTKPKAPPPAAPAEAPGEVPPHERPVADRQQENPEGKAAPSVNTPATPEEPERKTDPGAKLAPPPAGPAAAPGTAPPEHLPPAERKTGKPSA